MALFVAVFLQLGESQATYRRSFDARNKENNNTGKVGDWV